jgi:hypothetical protein
MDGVRSVAAMADLGASLRAGLTSIEFRPHASLARPSDGAFASASCILIERVLLCR